MAVMICSNQEVAGSSPALHAKMHLKIFTFIILSMSVFVEHDYQPVGGQPFEQW